MPVPGSFDLILYPPAGDRPTKHFKRPRQVGMKHMKKLIVVLTLSIAFTPHHSEAQSPAFPPDFYNDFDRDG